jgi:hypothetical protein
MRAYARAREPPCDVLVRCWDTGESRESCRASGIHLRQVRYFCGPWLCRNTDKAIGLALQGASGRAFGARPALAVVDPNARANWSPADKLETSVILFDSNRTTVAGDQPDVDVVSNRDDAITTAP